MTRASLVNALTIAGSAEEALIAADGLIDAAEATDNPYVLSYALLCYGMAYRDTDPVGALDALRRGISVTRESGNRFNESHLAHIVSALEAKYGDPLAALDYVTLAIRNYYDAGSFAFIHPALANLAAILDGLGRCEPAAIVASAALSPITAAAFPEINAVIAHLRDELSDESYESLARKGESDDHRRDRDVRIRPDRPGPNGPRRRRLGRRIDASRWNLVYSNTCSILPQIR